MELREFGYLSEKEKSRALEAILRRCEAGKVGVDLLGRRAADALRAHDLDTHAKIREAGRDLMRIPLGLPNFGAKSYRDMFFWAFHSEPPKVD